MFRQDADYVVPAKTDLTGIRELKPRNTSEGRCLPTAARTEEGNEFSLLDVKADAVDGDDTVESLLEAANPKRGHEATLVERGRPSGMADRARHSVDYQLVNGKLSCASPCSSAR